MSQQFDVNVTEWRVLKAVQPLFATPIHWELEARTGSADHNVTATANAITFDSDQEIFAYEMRELCIHLTHLAEFRLEQQSFESCREKMRRLLLCLENLVLERVLDDPDAQEVLTPPVESEYESKDFYQPTSLARMALKKVSDWLRFDTSDSDLEQMSTAHNIHPDLYAPEEQIYKKLQALGRIMENRVKQEIPLLDVCKAFINLRPTVDRFLDLKERTIKVNRVVDGLPQQTNAASLTLQRNTKVVHGGIISDVCGTIREFENRKFRIRFDKEDLWYNRADPQSPVSTNNSRMISLGDLLERGFFSNERDGDIFSPNDKAVLTLSLARSLIHLWQGLWTRGPWTAESIRFVYATNEILDRHNPYINCTVARSTEEEPQLIKPTLHDLELSVLGFAQLLAEIEIGQRIRLDLSTLTIESFRQGIENAMKPRRNEFGRADYNAAVEKCLQFTVLLRRRYTYEKDGLLDGRDDLLAVARDILYINIIKPLEKNFCQIPNTAAAMCPRPLKLEGHGTSYEPVTPMPPVVGGNISLNYPNTQRPKGNDTAVMLFDGESTTRLEHVTRAKAFFEAFKRFRKHHITPKVMEGRNDRPRIRIAVLDTGIDLENVDIRGLVDEIKDTRKKQNIPQKDRTPIREIQNFTGEDEVDIIGHGTHVAGLVLQTAPDADLYIAKVSHGNSFTDMGAIVKAIKWAVMNKADIINMSFGCDTDVVIVAEALDAALNDQSEDHASNTKRSKPVVLAAAANNGPNSKRMFPARHPGVIAVHSLDGKGNDEGGMNPSRRGFYENFGTLGLGIEVSWDEMRSGSNLGPDISNSTVTTTHYKSGSSYATPILAGIVANCIEWLDYMVAKGQLEVNQYSYLRKPKGIRLMLMKQSAEVGDILSIAPWILWLEGQKDPEDPNDPLNPVNDREAPRQVDEKADNRVLHSLLAELNPIS
ncbi:hypothetical protein O1611_g3958 [Lasiodiplodia mahajangana]|uniref:Uncharacterized protein n=1 Tax=Lasiodiplodia mahajangana TaxID=1108764 RepID=A0ACC2JQF9_9PEZI|nr:hypothetical protein O1611_g3958 [Lasiodiplodia mahajangana]